MKTTTIRLKTRTSTRGIVREECRGIKGMSDALALLERYKA